MQNFCNTVCKNCKSTAKVAQVAIVVLIEIVKWGSFRLLSFQNHRDRVNAPALISWNLKTFAFKDVAKVRVTRSTPNFSADSWRK
jgi:hypothetical protein